MELLVQVLVEVQRKGRKQRTEQMKQQQGQAFLTGQQEQPRCY